MFRRVLVANRGEIALRIIRTLREMDITSIAAFSDADRDAPFVREADEAFRLGPPPAAQSYLDIEAILAVATEARVDAIHPGYGFLSENAEFVEAVTAASFVFIGPSAESVRLMGNKVQARRAVQKLGVPVVPGTEGPVSSVHEALEFAVGAGYPIAVKAAGGGGGRGIRVVREAAEMPDALGAASREAAAYFKNPEVYLEKYFHDPRHVEIQIVADGAGAIVHLGERDCSVQRRHQKLIEEAPSPAVNRDIRERMGEAAIAAARSAAYTSAGTVEFLLSREGQFYFLEMNTRIQVEHPVTELVAGVDLIREMILVAAGEPASVRGNLLDPLGHAIEARVNAEDPAADFRPTPALIERFRPPGGIGVRLDSGVDEGYDVPDQYDSLMAKLIVWAPEREGARRRLLRALDEFEIRGPSSTIPFSRAVLESAAFKAGEVGTTFVTEHGAELRRTLSASGEVQPPEWRTRRGEQREFQVEVNRRFFRVNVSEVAKETPAGPRPRARRSAATAVGGNAVTSPMHGTVAAVRRQVGDVVEEGETLFVIEAMKMENEVPSIRSGTIQSLAVSVGDTVEAGQELATVQ